MLGNTLTAPELLKNKGIRFETWKKWDKTVEMLPCTGQKQYEPNNSWLQNKQIEKGLKDRKDLLGIERVERSSQLAAAEWLPQESRARVTKKSGQEWTSFGLEENLELYLMPEEALLLLELNCLELTWEGVALSIQQAYSVLLGSEEPKCNIDEYRVYSHLVRQGYRLQRFRYKDGTAPHDRSKRFRYSSALKRKKLIHDPMDGFGITRDRTRAAVGDEIIKSCSTVMPGMPNKLQPGLETASNPDDDHIVSCKTAQQSQKCQTGSQPSADTGTGSEMTVSTEIKANGSEDKVNNALKICTPADGHSSNVGNEGGITTVTLPFSEDKEHTTDNMGSAKKLPSELYDNGVLNLPGPSNLEAKKTVKNSGKDSKLQIISDETFLGDFKIISKWPGTRIQRNVKLMPKRCTDGTLPSFIGKTNNDTSFLENTHGKGISPVGNTRLRIDGAPTSLGMATNINNSNGRKRERTHEVIEVSDDEIEEVPLKMSRMEMLNLFPNVMSKDFVAKQISRKYLPRNVWPQKISNKFFERNMSSEDKREGDNAYKISRGDNSSSSRLAKDIASSMNPDERSRQNISTNTLFSSHGPRLGNVAAGQMPHRNSVSSYGTTSVTDFDGNSVHYRKEISRQGLCFHRDFFESRTTYQRYCHQAAPWVARANKGVFGNQEHVSVQLGIYTNVAIAQSIWGKSQFFRRGLLHRQNLWTNMSYYHSKQNLVNFMPLSPRSNTAVNFPNMTRQRPLNNSRYLGNNNHPNLRRETEAQELSFKMIPKASSWAETKARWLDEKTITIEDEDCENDEDTMVDESEVKVVARPVKPLVGRQNATSLAQVYNNLQIIKPATNKNFRRSRKVKQTECHKISYNLYSTTQHYKKANPGPPMYRVVVFRSGDTPFIELADIVQLQEDADETPIVLACASQASVTFAELGTVRIPDIQHNYSER